MKKYSIVCFSLLLFAGCKGKQADRLPADTQVSVTKLGNPKPAITRDTVFRPYKLVDDFVVTDTGYYDFMVGGGYFEVVKKDGKLVDTIDRDLGFKKLNTGEYIYLKVVGEGHLPKDISDHGHKLTMQGSIDKYIILKDNKKAPFNKVAPYVNDYFSSLEVINGMVYYWQIEKLKSGNNHISAARFDPTTRKSVSHYLFDDYIETDASIYFDLPTKKGGFIFFRDYKFDEDFQLIK